MQKIIYKKKSQSKIICQVMNNLDYNRYKNLNRYKKII